MTKEITKAIILQQLQDKFALREFEPAHFLFDETVVPVYEVGAHLKRHFVGVNTLSITSMSGYTFFTVPDNERWVFNAYNITFMTGSYKVSGLYILRISSGSGNPVYLDLELGRTGSYAINLATPVVLDAGDTIQLYVDDYTSTGSLRLSVDLTKETIR